MIQRCMGCMNEFDTSASAQCPHCGYDTNTAQVQAHYLKPGTVLEGQYIVGKVIGAGGFGITYVAWDESLRRKVAIKEYFPSEIATRFSDSTEVTMKNSSDSEQYEYWLRSFIDEALRLASMDSLTGIVHIFNSFVANCTAYIVMEYLEGDTLGALLKKRNEPVSCREVLEMVIPALYSLDAVHKVNIIHRDIAPDNIMRLPNGKIKIFDFGSAKNSTVNNENLAILVKPGYSPVEQYDLDSVPTPATDMYSMAAVMYHMVTGKRPIDSLRRAQGEKLATPTELGIEIPESVENLIMFALNIEPEYRFQSAREFADALSQELPNLPIDEPTPPPAPPMPKWLKAVIGAAAAVVVVVIAGIFVMLSSPDNERIEKTAALADFYGMTYEEVVKQMESYGYDVEIVKYEKSTDDKSGDGKVIEQNPKKDESYNVDDKEKVLSVYIGKYVKNIDELKKAKIKMPDLKGKTEEEANEILEENGFVEYSFGDPVYSNEIESGKVAKQSVEAGETVTGGTKIVLNLSKGKEVTTTKATTKATTKPTTTKAQTTKAPTKAPTTKAPTTKAHTTKAPVTVTTTKATTQAPTTKVPTTAPTPTKAPATQAPVVTTTKAPTTKAPTTKAPTKPPVVTTTKAPAQAPLWDTPEAPNMGEFE